MSNNIWQGTTTNWGTGSNWSATTAPANTEDAYLGATSVQAISAGLAQSGVTLNSLNISQAYTGAIGSASSYLNIGATTFNIGTAAPSSSTGSRRLNIQCANSGAVVNVFGSGSTALDSSYTPVRLLTTSAPVNVTGGTVGIALGAGETSSITTLKVSTGAGVPSVVLGEGTTTTTISQFSGTVISRSSNTTTTATVNGGTLIKTGSGAITTLNVNANTTVYYDGTGTITTLNITGTIDFSRGTGAVTITNANVYKNAKIKDPLGRVTFTNPFVLKSCRLADIDLDFGISRSVQIS